MINIFLGGERSILLSYRDIYSIFGLFPGFLELQPVLRRLRRAVLLIKKRAIFDRFISSIRIIDPSAIVRREVGTVASGVISQEDLNSQQICPFSADSCSPFFLGGSRSILLSYRRIWFCRAVQRLKALYPLSHDAVKTSFSSGISRTFFRQKTLQSYPTCDMFNLHGWISRKNE